MLTKEEALVREIVERYICTVGTKQPFFVPAGISNRHIHLCREDMEVLFGPGHELQHMKDLVQKKAGYAAKETLTVVGPKGVIEKVRILGPLRSSTQVELLITDSRKLGIILPVRESGSQEPSPSLTLVGPKGAVTIHKGVMAAWRHVHLSPQDAEQLGLKDGDSIKVRNQGDRSVIFENVQIRVGDFVNEMHLDVDEANAANIKDDDKIELLIW